MRLAFPPAAPIMAKKPDLGETAMDRDGTYAQTYAAWQHDPEAFWRQAAQAIEWFREPDRIFDRTQGVYGRWFPDARCNTCHNAVDRHVTAGHGAQAAILYDSAMTGEKRTITYAELMGEVSVLGAVLRDLGVRKGDRVVL